VHHILDEIVMGGMVLETSMVEIITHIEGQEKVLKSEVRPRAVQSYNTVPVWAEPCAAARVHTTRARPSWRKSATARRPKKSRPWVAV
jgi:hypothetical protein